MTKKKRHTWPEQKLTDGEHAEARAKVARYEVNPLAEELPAIGAVRPATDAARDAQLSSARRLIQRLGIALPSLDPAQHRTLAKQAALEGRGTKPYLADPILPFALWLAVHDLAPDLSVGEIEPTLPRRTHREARRALGGRSPLQRRHVGQVPPGAQAIDAGQDEAPGALDVLLESEEREAVRVRLEGYLRRVPMTPRERRLIMVLRTEDDWSLAHLARRVKRTPAAIKKALARLTTKAQKIIQTGNHIR